MLTNEEKMEACRKFFADLAKLLGENYEMLGSCNNDSSVYLIPNGTEPQVTYYGKPKQSFRLSDHWNWYTSLLKCDRENYVQCESVDMPKAKKRPLPWKASKPVQGIQVCMIGKDRRYHHVFGEKYDRKTKKWEWIETNPNEIASLIMSA